MTDQGDRMGRAGSYVLGLMDEKERERAERDLENDPSFREAVVEMAGRMHVLDRPPAPAVPPDGLWQEIKERIAELPQMRRAARAAEAPPSAPATFGRRRSDPKPKPPVPARRPVPLGIGLHSLGGRRGIVLGLALAVAFALGFLAGRM